MTPPIPTPEPMTPPIPKPVSTEPPFTGTPPPIPPLPAGNESVTQTFGPYQHDCSLRVEAFVSTL